MLIYIQHLIRLERVYSLCLRIGSRALFETGSPMEVR
jgi:hypothetical protein